MSAMCPVLATPIGNIITKDIIDSLVLSNYSREHGTSVSITCLSAPYWVLEGPSDLTCLNTSQWNRDPPICKLIGMCPELAPPNIHDIITDDNIDSLALSTNARTVGTVVDVSCLYSRRYVLKGAARLTCLSTESWYPEPPTCVDPSKVEGTGEGESSDLTMVPILVAAAVAGALVLIFVAVMVYINCCWRKESCRRRPSHKPSSRLPIGLFRSLGSQAAERDHNRRLRRYYPPSEESDFLESVSTRDVTDGPRAPVPNSPARPSRNPLFHDNRAFNRGDEPPFPPYITGRNNSRPEYHTSVGSGRSYRTWHDLFYT